MTRLNNWPALKEFVMRYTPAAVALSLFAAVSSSALLGAANEPDPRAEALAMEGRAALEAGDTQGAIDAFEAALVVDPSYTNVYVDLADAARADGLQGKAIHYYREALERDPDNLSAISGEGAALAEKGALDNARRNLARLEEMCGATCKETVELASAIQAGPIERVVTAEAVTPDNDVTVN